MDKNVPPMDAMFFENLVNTIREPLLVLDSDLRVIQANRCFYKTFKVPPEKTAGSLVYDLGNGQWDIPPLRRLLEKILPEASSFDDYEVDHYFPGIGHKTMLLNARRVIREDIGSHLILLAIEDITDRKALKLEVAESEERFRRLFETAKDGLLLLDKKTGRILEANPAITELLGYAGEELIGKELGEFGLLGDKGDFQEVLRIATEWGFFRIDDIPVGTKSGGSTDADVYFVDRAQLLQCNVRDIRERKRADENLRESKEKLAISEERYRHLIETSSDWVWEVDANGVYVFSSPNIHRILGIEPEEVVGKTLCDFMPPEEAKRIAKIFNDNVSKQVPFHNLKNVNRHKDGHLVVFETRGVPYFDNSGGYRGYRGMSRDITERTNREQALKESEEQLHIIFNGSKDGMLLTNAESRKFHTANKTFCDMLRYTLDEIRQLGVEDIHPKEDLPWIYDEFEKARRQGIETNFDIPVKRKDGVVLSMDLRSAPVTIAGEKYMLATFRDVTERKMREAELLLLHMAVSQSAEAVVITDSEGTIEYVNPAFEQITGYSREEAIGRTPRILKSGLQKEEFYRILWETLLRGEMWKGRFVNRKKDGSLYEEEATISPVRNASGKIVHFVGGKRDITRDVMLQKQVETALRMETVGTLAGGIAHDFNNALTGIMGFGELMRLRLAGDSQSIADLDEILHCADRAATLTGQLLAFARRQIIKPTNLSLNAVVTNLVKFISKTIGEHIEVKTILAEDLKSVHADQAQIEHVLMNLCLNARDAMPQGGTLRIVTENVYLDEEYVSDNVYMKEGKFVLLEISDTGIGMDKQTRERVFEPFFTTKGPDKGTGLGLSMVYGTVKQHNGFIHLYSELGKGTTFKVYLPAIEALPDAVAEKRREEIVRGGTETILVAEDEESIRSLAERTLKEIGYNVLLARNGAEAIEIFRRNKEIALAVLDVVMPMKGGKEAFDEMQKENQQLKVIFISGYSADAIHESFVLTPEMSFLRKPFGPITLARKIREVLDTPD